MIGQFQDFNHEDNKGLFTFYREQAEKEQEIRRLKKERKIAKAKQEEAKRIKQEQENANRDARSKLSSTQNKDAQKQGSRSQRDPMLLYQPKNRRQKYKKQQLGTSVVIVNSRELINEHRSDLTQRSVDQKYNLKRIEQLINPQNNNRYFLQNKELPVSFGKMSIEKQITKVKGPSEDTERYTKVRSVLKPSYFNSYNSADNDQKFLASISYEKLPELQRKPPNSQLILPRRYKSKKIETALKSNNSDLIRQIRESLRQQSSALDKVSYIDAINSGPMFNAYEKEYEDRLNARLDARQKRLIDIIRNSTNINKRKT